MLLRLLTSDLFELMKACCTGNLAKLNIEWSKKQAIGIVIATSGYPGKIVTGLEISSNEFTIVVDLVVGWSLTIFRYSTRQ